MTCARKIFGLVLSVPLMTPVLAQPNQNVITLERGVCFGVCPAYLLQIDSSGAVSFRQGPPRNRRPEQASRITPEQFQDLVARFATIGFFDIQDFYPPAATDGPVTHIGLTLDGKTKTVTHSDRAPRGLEELERTIERVTNIHRWLDGDPRRFTLQSPVAGPFMGGGEDLKNEMFVRHDAYNGIKPGLNDLMRAAGFGAVSEIRQELEKGADVNGGDETGWTALMIAAVTTEPESVSALLDAGARVDQRDVHGDTALIGAAAVRFGKLKRAAEVLGILLAHGASVDATNELGESALMWAARSGNPDSIQVLVRAGADPTRVDRASHDALYYLRDARAALSFDKAAVQRYDQAELALAQQ